MDSNVQAVMAKHRSRADMGLVKYGVTTERADLSFVDWLQHLQEELMDAAVYAQRLMADGLTEKLNKDVSLIHELMEERTRLLLRIQDLEKRINPVGVAQSTFSPVSPDMTEKSPFMCDDQL